MIKKIIFLLIILSYSTNQVHTQNRLDLDSLSSDEILFKNYPIVKSIDTTALFRAVGAPVSTSTYKELEMDIEFAEFHYYYNFSGFNVRLFIANNTLYFGHFALDSVQGSILIKDHLIQVGDSFAELASIFPRTYKYSYSEFLEYQKNSGNNPYPFIVYYSHIDSRYDHYGSIMFEIKGEHISKIFISGFTE